MHQNCIDLSLIAVFWCSVHGNSYVLPNSQRCAELFFIQAIRNQLDNCFVLYNLLQTSGEDSFPNPRRAAFSLIHVRMESRVNVPEETVRGKRKAVQGGEEEERQGMRKRRKVEEILDSGMKE